MKENEKIQAYRAVEDSLGEANTKINNFCMDVLRTRGGRIGSGMGGLLEALWGYHVNSVIGNTGRNYCELAWFPDHQYHDFACVRPGEDWSPETGEGEYFRVEAKSMNLGAEESKAHFDVLNSQLDDFDALLLLVWNWVDIDGYHCCPQIVDSFFAPAKPITILRDALHLKRGGSFVDTSNCPDGCEPDLCQHLGEPLNERGKRERISGPQSCRPSSSVSYAANFGGLVRMLKTRGAEAKQEFRNLRRSDEVIDGYISFIHRNLPPEELNHFSIKEWRQIGNKIGVANKMASKEEIYSVLREQNDYQRILKKL